MSDLGLHVPLKIISLTNQREHWSIRAKRARLQRNGIHLSLMANLRVKPDLPCIVILTRIAPRELDDDNLASGFKATRDGVADWLAIDDRDRRVQWRYAQRRGKPKEYAATIEFVAAT